MTICSLDCTSFWAVRFVLSKSKWKEKLCQPFWHFTLYVKWPLPSAQIDRWLEKLPLIIRDHHMTKIVSF